MRKRDSFSICQINAKLTGILDGQLGSDDGDLVGIAHTTVMDASCAVSSTWMAHLSEPEVKNPGPLHYCRWI
mgnify:CR=1 FL=1